MRSTEPADDRIVIVGITEKDLRRLDQSAIDDGTLNTVINKIKAGQPRVIGLDMHRNLSTCRNSNSIDDLCKLNSKKLAATFRNTPNLIGVDKSSGGHPGDEAILPHPDLIGRTGDSAMIEDPDVLSRRAYLSVIDENQVIALSFGADVALKYLEKEDVSAEIKDNSFQINNVLFPNIGLIDTGKISILNYLPKLAIKLIDESRYGKFYPFNDIKSYQILLNYRHNDEPFKQITISQILADDFFLQSLKDKIVLIGGTYLLSGDIYYAPALKDGHEKDGYELVYGVEIHAQLISSLVSAVLEDRTVLNFSPRLIELVLTLFLLSEAYLFIYKLDKKYTKGLTLLIASAVQIIIILVGGWISLLLGCWIPGANFIFTTCVNLVILSVWFYHENQEKEKNKLEKLVQQRTKSLQQSLDDLQKIQQKLIDQEKLNFLGRNAIYISHEIRNPLGIIGLGNLAITKLVTKLSQLEKLDSEQLILTKILDRSHMVAESIERIDNIIFLLNSHAKSGVSEASECDINKIIQEAFELTKYSFATRHHWIESKSIQLKTDYAPDIPLACINRPEFERAIVNLIDNSLFSLMQKKAKNSNFSPKLFISSMQLEDKIKITIEDNGEGIKPQDEQRIFEEFYTTKGFQGTGLGLFLVKQTIEGQHGGKLKLETKWGEFARIELFVPLNAEFSL